LYITKSNNAIVTCLDAKTGTVLYGPERLEGTGNFYASPVAAAGRVYLVGRDGTTVVIKDSDKLEVLATNKLDEGIDASPAVAGKQLFLRGKENLYCLSAE
jgi:outer membrane protein assembly factor BamB